MERGRKRAVVGAIVVAACVLLSACTPPEVQGAFDAWKKGDRAGASVFMTPQALDQLWSVQPWSAQADWKILWCSPKEQFGTYTPNGPECAWGDRLDDRLWITQDPSTHRVASVVTQPSPDPKSGQVLAAWERGDRAAAAPFLTPAALDTLFAIPRDPNIVYSNHCDNPGGGSPWQCTFMGYDYTKPIIAWKAIEWTRPVNGDPISDVAWVTLYVPPPS